ncbi:hypothetical protein [Aliiroseovarius subalbicans]|uniref:hypothetical protein n=1 Tax=Aliiroseovarius subalbicans TaxID=2925840 RepID=UPI001F567A91|nr:hypothetical protein [Aliiroseovarius subalbicans]MCI2398074.1 hypothetical protein [Aliiroseovarius subalbicans]
MSAPLATLSPTSTRRRLSTLLIFALSVLFLWMAATASSLPGAVLPLVLGLATLWIAARSLRSWHLALILTDTTLCDSSGRILVRMDDIRSVDRSAFAFKPSNGFMLRLDAPGPLTWMPGLWWRVGNRLAIGGATQPAETRIMADQIGFLLAARTR